MATGHSKAGFQSVLARDDTSAEAKQHAKEQLGMSDKSHSDKSSSGDDIDVDDDADRQLVGGENSGEVLTSWVQERVLRGHKAAVHNPKVSKQAKEHSRQVLEENDADY
ncbi:hypothetical protein JCM24511_03036 [Saitozyma sp. JCM 24511]|nr:hypothetical protein JCM24511_03036 [Saitozyma sp. JCM 24511]